MYKIEVHPVDHVWVRVDCEDAVAHELSGHFAFDVPGAKFMPSYRKRYWTGKIHLFKLRGHLLYRGLLPRLLSFAATQGYTVENFVPDAAPLLPEPDQFAQLLALLKLPVAPRDYQLAALRTLLNTHRGIVLSPTGSGKSLIIHLLVQCLSCQTLIVVPTIGLVAQMESDLKSYGCDPRLIQTIQGGREKDITCPIVISTWQSIYTLGPEYFRHFRCVIVDEVHLAKAKSLTGLMESCGHTPYRFGFTGTLDDLQVHQLILEGLFGTVTRVTTTHELMQQKHLSPLRVKMCVIQYPPDVCKSLRRAQYPDEVEAIVMDPGRLDVVARMALAATGNVLVLFNYVEKHGKPLHRRLQELAPERDIHFVSGEVPADDRERIRQWVEGNTNQIIVASYGTFSTGINIPSLQTLIFASPSKSKIRVLQSIGRSLRVTDDKAYAVLIDVVDDLRIGSYVNHTFRHAESRIQYYASERFPYSLKEMRLEGWLEVLGKLSGRS